MHTYTNKKTQEYVDGLQADLDTRDLRIASLRRAAAQSKPQERIVYKTVKISSLTADEQSKVIRFGK